MHAHYVNGKIQSIKLLQEDESFLELGFEIWLVTHARMEIKFVPFPKIVTRLSRISLHRKCFDNFAI